MNNKCFKNSALILIISVLFVFSFFMLPDTALAFGEFDPGGSLNPIYVEITPSPSMQAQQAQQEFSQAMERISQMATVTGCDAQDNAISSYFNSLETTDNSHPNDQRDSASYLNYLLNRYDMCVKYMKPITYGRSCVAKFGSDSLWSGTLNNKGEPICECKSGYQWGGNLCVAIPTKTNNQICSDSYGLNSIWSGTLNNKGALICGCSEGSVWNKSWTSCVAITQRCQEDYGSANVVSDGQRPGNYACRCSDGYIWNDAKTACILTEIEKISPPIITPKAERLKPTINNEPINAFTSTTSSSSISLVSPGNIQESANMSIVSVSDNQQKQIQQVTPTGKKRGFWSWIRIFFSF